MGMTHPSDDSAPVSPTAPEPYIKLDQFLKWQGAVESGGTAKMRIAAGEVKVDGEVEMRRGRKLRTGNRVEIDGECWTVQLDESASTS